jgi:hypothetical protein
MAAAANVIAAPMTAPGPPASGNRASRKQPAAAPSGRRSRRGSPDRWSRR